jgi:hypothetical protein
MQSSLFNSAGLVKKEWKRHPVKQPFGNPDKAGEVFYQRFDKRLCEALHREELSTAMEILLEWPAERMEALRVILVEWVKAAPLERDNFLEMYGK